MQTPPTHGSVLLMVHLRVLGSARPSVLSLATLPPLSHIEQRDLVKNERKRTKIAPLNNPPSPSTLHMKAMFLRMYTYIKFLQKVLIIVPFFAFEFAPQKSKNAVDALLRCVASCASNASHASLVSCVSWASYANSFFAWSDTWQVELLLNIRLWREGGGWEGVRGSLQAAGQQGKVTKMELLQESL